MLVLYTEGIWNGVLGNEVVSLISIPEVAIEMTLAFITESEDFFTNGSNWQGILGLAYAQIAKVLMSDNLLYYIWGRKGVFTVLLCLHSGLFIM